jgi:transposase-like protein
VAYQGFNREEAMNINITNPMFHDEAKALAHLEASRWPDGAHCPHCGSVRVRKMEGKTQAGMWLCNDCRDKFTVRTGSVMERSHVPLHKWLLATHIMAASKKGMSAAQMARMIGVTYKTAWFLCHRIREAMDGADNGGPLGGNTPTRIVEADETYVGGKAKNRAWGKIPEKKIVLSLVEREGHVRSFHIANLNAKNVRALIVTNVDRKAHLMTDESSMYKMVGLEMRAHTSVNHGKKQYVRHQGLSHSNTAENFFSIFKRGVIGTYHHMSEAHLGRYCREFDLRYNTRDMTDAERADVIVKGMIGRRLTYRRIDKLAA